MKKISKQQIETVKTVVIAILVTGVIAFVCGMQYQARVEARNKAEVNNTVTMLKG